MQDDITDGVYYLIEQGIADKDRIAILVQVMVIDNGWSYVSDYMHQALIMLGVDLELLQKIQTEIQEDLDII